MKKLFHRNQVIITTLAFLIAIAGYISYDRSMSKQENAKEASADLGKDDYTIDNSSYDIFTEVEPTESSAEALAMEEMKDTELIDNPGETVLTGVSIGNVDYAAAVKLNREQVRSKNKEALKDIIDNTALSEEQKQEAIDEMLALTDIAEKEAAAEMLLEAKGFTNVVVSITDGACDVVLDMGEVTDAKRAQVEDIVKRKTGLAAENIIITTISSES